MALQPSILVLDEPTSQLDPVSAENLLLLLKDLNRHQSFTIILSEHRLERVLPFTDRIVHLDRHGNLQAHGHPREVFKKIDIEVPLIDAAKRLGWESMPLSVEEARNYSFQFDTHIKTVDRDNFTQTENHPNEKQDTKSPSSHASFNSPIIQVNNLSFSYNSTPAISNLSLDIRQGETVILMGVNGSGKSTLLRCIVGLLKPQHGVISLGGHEIDHKSVAEICREVAYLPQDPNMLLFADHVEDELWITLHNHEIQIPPISPQKLLTQLGLLDKASQYPRDLSTGERQRVALGAILITKPGAILLDEPTRGLDYAAKRNLIDLLKTFQNEGKAILLITHDIEFAAQIADRVVIMDKGEIINQGSPMDVFSANSPYGTQIAQAFPGKGWIVPQDVNQDIR
jgi:energy-coupling factor transporter ATP-binding protein EcfA2